MKRLNIFLPFIVCSVLTIFLFLRLQQTQQTAYLYREDMNIFLFDVDWIVDQLSPYCGVIDSLGKFFVQLFDTAFIGALLTALLSALGSFFLWLVMRLLGSKGWMFPLAFLPEYIECFLLSETYRHYGSIVAILFLSVSLWIYSYLLKRDYRQRVFGGAILTLILLHTSGSIALYFAISALLIDILKNVKKALYGVLPVVAVLIVSYIYVNQGLATGYDNIFTGKCYSEYYVENSLMLSVPLLSLLFILIVSAVAKRFQTQETSSPNLIMAMVLSIILCLAFYKITDRTRLRDLDTQMELFHNIDKEQWGAIISNPNINMSNDILANCLNLALSHEGRLLDDLYKYPQKNVFSLMSDAETFAEESSLLAHIYYQMGLVSRSLAFSLWTMAGTYPGTPELLKLNIKLRLILGDYAVAEKYIRFLEKTWKYGEWARSQRRFLWNDQAVEADKELGNQRKNLPENSSEFASLHGMVYDLTKVLDTNPTNVAARDYAIAALLLNKNYDDIKRFVETYYGTDVMTDMPLRLQEAVVAYSEKDADYCLSHGVEEKTLARFAAFREKVLSTRHAGRQGTNVKAGLSEFRDTFWFSILK